MIILLVYRPEADDNANRPHWDDPFSGVEVHTITASQDVADAVIVEEGSEHQDWRWLILDETAELKAEIEELTNGGEENE